MSDAELLNDFLVNNPEAGTELMRRLRSVVSSQLGRAFPFDYGLDQDQREEVLGWGLARFARKAPDLSAFEPKRASLATYLRPFMRAAARDVQASYTPPGERTRPGKAVRRAHTWSLDAVHRTRAEEVVTLGEMLSDKADPYATVEDRITVSALLEKAWDEDPTVAEALTAVYADEMTMTQAAKKVGVERATLQRRARRLAEAIGLTSST
jgi:DNA-binding phage protein